jgi:hypothetical protein
MIGLTFLFPNQQTPLMFVADQFDHFVETRINREMQWLRATSGDSVWVCATASFVEVVWEILRSYVDTLRYGSDIDRMLRELAQGDASRVEEHLWNDIFRALNLIPMGSLLGKGIARVGRLLSVRQAAGTYTCSWIANANAARVTGQALMLSEDELMRAAGVSSRIINSQMGTTPETYRLLQRALTKLKIQFLRHRILDMQGLVQTIRSNRQSVFTFSFATPQSPVGHTVYATFNRSRQAVMFVDTDGSTYHTLASFLERYPGAALDCEFPILEYPNSWLVKGNDFVQLFFPIGRVVHGRITEADEAARNARIASVSGRSRQDRRRIVMGSR